jgi:hypothetical protein
MSENAATKSPGANRDRWSVTLALILIVAAWAVAVGAAGVFSGAAPGTGGGGAAGWRSRSPAPVSCRQAGDPAVTGRCRQRAGFR